MEVCGESEKSSENVCEGYDVSRFVMSLGILVVAMRVGCVRDKGLWFRMQI